MPVSFEIDARCSAAFLRPRAAMSKIG